MKRLSRSLNSSRNTSRTTSRSSSVNSLLGEKDNTAEEMLNTDAIEIEAQMPTDVDEVPAYYKKFTMDHPLGSLILRMSTLNRELCKKLNHEPEDNPELNEVCKNFVDAIKLERSRTNNKVNKATINVEDTMLQKELNFHAVNASVQPPEYFSPVPILTTPKKMQDALKTFPSRDSQKFSGTKTDNILEFLHAMNTSQSIVGLSKSEFLQILQKCVSGKVYTLVSETINYGNDVNDVYHSLITLYDNRISSATARRLLLNYKATKGQNLTKVQAQVMEYCSRIASDLPIGDSRTHMFNIEANSGLVRCLPHQSSTIVTNQINSLAARLQRNPTYVELIKALHKYAETINLDLARNGANPSRQYHTTADIMAKANHKVYSIDKKNQKGNNQRNQHGPSNNRNQNSNNRYNKGSRGRNNYTPSRFSVNSMKLGDKNRVSEKYERAYNMNQGQRSKGGASEIKGRYCTLCGSRSHTADMICFRMRDSANRIIEVVPTYFPCEICLKKLGKKLYHPSNVCFSRDKSQDAENDNRTD